MANKIHLTSLRIDTVTHLILKRLTKNSNLNQSQIVRLSIRLFHELNKIKKQHGEILVRAGNKEELVILLS